MKIKQPKAPVLPVEHPPIYPTSVYTLEQAAAHATLCVDLLVRAMRNGQLRYSQIGTRKIVLGEWLLDWIRENANLNNLAIKELEYRQAAAGSKASGSV